MDSFSDQCFVCENTIADQEYTRNKILNLPVCANCRDSEQEKQAVQDHLDSLADGFVCGCI